MNETKHPVTKHPVRLELTPANGGPRNIVKAYDGDGDMWFLDTGDRDPDPNDYVDSNTLRSLFYVIEEAVKLRAQLEDISRALVVTDAFKYCPSCANNTEMGHAEDCEYKKSIELAYDIAHEANMK